MGKARKDALRLDFDRRLKLEFHGTKVAVPRVLFREILERIGQLCEPAQNLRGQHDRRRSENLHPR